MLGWDRYGFDRKSDGTRYAKILFLHPMGSVGHVVHSSALGALNVPALFFHARVGPVQFPKKRIETR
jgi:hypothetical protein